jgi:CheY-like chemotaxis protein
MLQPANFSVLMVDDTTAIREAIARSLTRRGCRVTTATSGVEALEILRKQSFDVIVTDLNMPDRGGLWLWRQALALRPELRGRFVLVASEPLPEPRSLELFLETERFVLKPVPLEMLWHHVEDVITRAATTEGGARAEPRVSGAQRAESAP